MLLKVTDGTPRTGKSLCLSCRHATVIHGSRSSIISCDMISNSNHRQLDQTQPVHSCTEYDDKSMPSLMAFKEIAWELKPNKKTGSTGFVPPNNKFVTLTNPMTGKEVY